MASSEQLEVLTDQNPWHLDGVVPDQYAPRTERPLAKRLWRRALDMENRRAQLILGPRRVGKTTVMYQTVRHLIGAGIQPGRLWWLRLDHPALIEEDLGSLMRTVVRRSSATVDEPVWLFLDELVYKSNWDLWLKTAYDEHWPMRIVATSSATAAMRERRPESGVGRWDELFLMPYLFTEFLDLLGEQRSFLGIASITGAKTATASAERTGPDLQQYRDVFTLIGGFPELIVGLNRATALEDTRRHLLESQQQLRSDAVERAIYKDIPQAFRVDDPLKLERLLYMLAGQIAGLISPKNLCSALELSQPTLDRYLGYLERAFLVFTLPNYSGSEASVQKRGRKVYFVDGAVRNAALQRGLRPLTDPSEKGLLAENLVAAQFHTLAHYRGGGRLYHWRDQPYEVDLVFDDQEEPIAVELASSPRHSLNGLLEFRRRHSRFRDRCYLSYPGALYLHPTDSPDGVGRIGIDVLCLIVGGDARAAIEGSGATSGALWPPLPPGADEPA